MGIFGGCDRVAEDSSTRRFCVMCVVSVFQKEVHMKKKLRSRSSRLVRRVMRGSHE